MKIGTKEIVIIILVALLIVAGVYILYQKWQAREQNIFVQGAQYGYEQSILEIMQGAAKCAEPVPVYAEGGNVTMHLVATECFQQPQTQNTSIKK